MTENIIDKPAIDAVKEQYEVYGEYVNLHRHIPYIYDGLKPSYRRIIQAAFDVAKDKLVKTNTIVGKCIGNYHPHGDASLTPVVSELVHAGILKGKGNHGAEQLIGGDLEPAAGRYTEARISDNYRKLLTPLLGEVPTFINEFNVKEYEYLPTPIPLGLMFGYLGIGIGTGCRIPAFTAESILDAYLNDNPDLLRTASGVKISSNTDLHNIWDLGTGRINYEMEVEDCGDRVLVKGSKGPIKLNWDWFMDFRNQGRLDINELSSGSGLLVEIHKMPRVQYPSHQEIYEQACKITKGGESYYVRVVYNNQVRLIGLYDWIDITYKNYKKLYKQSIDKEISNLKWDIELYTNFRSVADKIINNTESYQEIADSLGISKELVDAIGRKSINTLRTADPKHKIPELQERILELVRFDIDAAIKSNITLM